MPSLVRMMACGTMAALAGLRSFALEADQADDRLRTVIYSDDEVYRLRGYVGYQIDLQFEAAESFVGLGAGDVEGIAFVAQSNHLFLKPKAVRVHTNLTVLTTRRSYHFEYSAGPEAPDPDHGDVVYALRFAYPSAPAMPRTVEVSSVAVQLAGAAALRAHNRDYWYCGALPLQPIEAWDDGVHTHLKFDARSELPALFVRNDDNSESLLNFNVEQDEVVIHRIARRFVVRRGRLTGCIVNKGFAGSGADLRSGTVAPDVERSTREVPDALVR